MTTKPKMLPLARRRKAEQKEARPPEGAVTPPALPVASPHPPAPAKLSLAGLSRQGAGWAGPESGGTVIPSSQPSKTPSTSRLP
jgi:hypothetical protein